MRSNPWTRLCPKNAKAVCANTTITSASTDGRPNSVLRASAPLTLLVANQPMPHMTVMNAAGTMLPR